MPYVDLVQRVCELEIQVAGYLAAGAAEPPPPAGLQKLDLTHTESLLYAALMAARPNVVSIPTLEAALPPRHGRRSPNFIHVVMAPLRRKVGKDTIENVWGRGFRIADGYQPPT